MGGSLALQLAIHEPRLTACVAHYGSLPTNPVDIRRIDAQVLGIFGSLNRMIPLEQIRAFEQCMIAENKLVDITIYNGAGHAFENPTNKSGYRREAAADAWFRTLAFFDQAKELKTVVS
jgi:carboxymethylenebutenolidase